MSMVSFQSSASWEAATSWTHPAFSCSVFAFYSRGIQRLKCLPSHCHRRRWHTTSSVSRMLRRKERAWVVKSRNPSQSTQTVGWQPRASRFVNPPTRCQKRPGQTVAEWIEFFSIRPVLLPYNGGWANEKREAGLTCFIIRCSCRSSRHSLLLRSERVSERTNEWKNKRRWRWRRRQWGEEETGGAGQD